MEERIQVRKFDKSLFFACLIGAGIGFILAEFLYTGVAKEWAPMLRTGLFFAVVAFFVCLLALISEMITGNLRGGSWKGRNTGIGLGITLLTALCFFLLGMLFQFLYGIGLNVRTAENVQDYIILIDNSGSTYNTDPDEERFSSVADLAGSLDQTQSLMVKVFDENVLGTFPMTMIGTDTVTDLQNFFAQFDSNGGTNLQKVLMEAVDEYTPTGRDTAVLLLSDGISQVNLDEISNAYAAKNLPVFCVSFSDSDFAGSNLLTQIANNTNGYYYEIDQLSDLTSAVETMIKLASHRQLLESRRGMDMGNNLARVLRILFVTILGCLLGVGISLTVDNSVVMTKGMPVHAAGSFLAALITEFGWWFLPGIFIRLLMSILMSLVAVWYFKEIILFDESSFGGSEIPKRPRRVQKPAKPKDLLENERDTSDPKSLI